MAKGLQRDGNLDPTGNCQFYYTVSYAVAAGIASASCINILREILGKAVVLAL